MIWTRNLSAPRPLIVIAGILVVSALVRVPFIASEAFALNAASEKETPTPTDDSVVTSQKLDLLLAELRLREDAIESREAELEEKAQNLDKFSAQIATQISELNDAEEQLRKVLAIADTAAEDDVARLTTVYENMKPKEAAQVFEQMQPAFAAGFLSQMRPDAAASIMSGLKPDSAYAISVVLAGRHVEPKEQ